MTDLSMMTERAIERLAMKKQAMQPAGSPAPVDPAMGGAPPAPAGGPPMDPAMGGAAPPMDPATAGAAPPMGAQAAPGGQIPPEMMSQMLADPQVIQMLGQMGITVQEGQAMDQASGQPIDPVTLEQIFISAMGMAQESQGAPAPGADPAMAGGAPPVDPAMGGAPAPAPMMNQANEQEFEEEGEDFNQAANAQLLQKMEEMSNKITELENTIDNQKDPIEEGLSEEALAPVETPPETPPAPPMGAEIPTPMAPPAPAGGPPMDPAMGGAPMQQVAHELPIYTERKSANRRINDLILKVNKGY